MLHGIVLSEDARRLARNALLPTNFTNPLKYLVATCSYCPRTSPRVSSILWVHAFTIGDLCHASEVSYGSMPSLPMSSLTLLKYPIAYTLSLSASAANPLKCPAAAYSHRSAPPQREVSSRRCASYQGQSSVFATQARRNAKQACTIYVKTDYPPV